MPARASSARAKNAPPLKSSPAGVSPGPRPSSSVAASAARADPEPLAAGVDVDRRGQHGQPARLTVAAAQRGVRAPADAGDLTDDVHHRLASDGGAWITGSPRLRLQLALRPREIQRSALPWQ